MTPSEGASSFGDERVDTGVDTAGAALEIGALIGSIGGAIAGGLAGTVGGPIGVAVGIWAGGLLGTAAGGWMGQAISDGLDNNDATIWYELSDVEKDAMIQALVFEFILGLVPAGIGKLIGKAPRIAGKANQLKDRVLNILGSAGKPVQENCIQSRCCSDRRLCCR